MTDAEGDIVDLELQPGEQAEVETNHTYRITLHPPVEAFWGELTARPGDQAPMRVKGLALPDGARVTLTVFEHDADGAHDLIDPPVEATVSRRVIEAAWTCREVDDSDDIYALFDLGEGGSSSGCEFFFQLELPNGKTLDSGLEPERLLRIAASLDCRMEDRVGQPLANHLVAVVLADGTVREETTDARGRLTLANLPPGRVRLRPAAATALEDVDELPFQLGEF